MSYRPKIAHESIKDLWYEIWPKSNGAFKFFKELFGKFSINCVSCANFELLSSKFVYECSCTKWCFIRHLVRIGRGLYFLFLWYQIKKFRCIHEDSSVRKPKSSKILSQKRNFVKSVRKQYGNSDSHAFLY